MKKDFNTLKIFFLALLLVIGLGQASADIVGEEDIDPGPPVEEVGTADTDLADADDVYLGSCYVDSPWAEPVAGFPGGQIKDIFNKDTASGTKSGGLALGCIPGVSDYDLDTYRLDVNGATVSRGLRSTSDVLTTDGVFVGVLPYQPSSKLLVGGKIGVGTDSPEQGLHIASDGGSLRLAGLAHGEENPVEICVSSSGVLSLCEEGGASLSANLSYGSAVQECEYLNHFPTVYATGGTGSYTYTWTVTYVAGEAGGAPVVTTSAPYSSSAPKIKVYRNTADNLSTTYSINLSVSSGGSTESASIGPFWVLSQDYVEAADGGPDTSICD
ncbi:hypothetical protein H6790_00360 [Candidatus Nomurabacteria bacterium]|nr:hypothetical protein [Candidatus Nomurabacteria bacterium]